jgi:cobalt-zinc-cadmium efflux system outer membrane protein
VKSAEAGVSIAGVRPDPQFNAGIASKELYGPNKPNASTCTTVGVAFTVETGGKRDARLRAARSNVRLTEAGVAAFKRQLDAQAAAGFVEACRVRNALTRKESTLAAMREVVRANETRFKAGDIGRLELAQSSVEADRFQTEVVTARAEAGTAEASLSTFLGRRFAEVFPGRALDCEWPDAPEQQDVESLVQRALEVRDDVKQAQAAVGNARDNVEVARANRSVDPTINLGVVNVPRVNASHDASGNVTNSPAQRSLALGLTVTVPIPFSRMQHGEVTQAESALTQAQLQLRSTLVSAETDVRVAYARYEATAINERTYQEHVLGEAERVLEGVRISYRKGAASLLELLSAQRSADEVYLGYLQARADRANATVKLQQSTGIDPAL